jgi:hypothetical protein
MHCESVTRRPESCTLLYAILTTPTTEYMLLVNEYKSRNFSWYAFQLFLLIFWKSRCPLSLKPFQMIRLRGSELLLSWRWTLTPCRPWQEGFEARWGQQCFNCLTYLDADINFLFRSEVIKRTSRQFHHWRKSNTTV